MPQPRTRLATALIWIGAAALGLWVPATAYEIFIMSALAVEQPENRLWWLLNIGGISFLPVLIGLVLIIAGLCLPRPAEQS